MHDPGRTPWDVLGITENAPFSDVKRAFFRHARRTHPDVRGGDAEAFRQVQAAFEALSRVASSREHPVRRPRATPYDRWLRRERRARQWTDNDPLAAEYTAASQRRYATFADALAAEM